jgi:hypothetical protein
MTFQLNTMTPCAAHNERGTLNGVKTRDSSKRFHGRPCPRCRGTERYVRNNQCCGCAQRASLAWAAANHEKTLEINRQAQARRRIAQSPPAINIEDLIK